jgi:hypothetical protein
MHYRALAFSKDRLSATIVPRDPKAFFAIGQRVRFSPMDLAKLNVLYNCGSNYYKGNDLPVESSRPESENAISSEDLFSKPGAEKEMSSSKPEKYISCKEELSKPGKGTETPILKHDKVISNEALFSKLGVETDKFPSKSEKGISSKEELFSNIEKGKSSSKPEKDFSSEEDLFSNSDI